VPIYIYNTQKLTVGTRGYQLEEKKIETRRGKLEEAIT
jgi:hypothetical protein